MIAVTRLDGSIMVVNDEQIAWIETRSDTVISMMNGEKLVVREGADTLVERTRDFKRSVLTRTPFEVRGRALAAAATVAPRLDVFARSGDENSDGDDA